MSDVCFGEPDNFPKYEDGPAAGAYVILDQLSGKFYVGSSWNLAARRHKHDHNFRKGKHPNTELQKCYNDGCITFIAIITEDRESAFDEEQRIVDLNWGSRYLLNRSKNVRVSFKGQAHSLETRRLLREKNLGKKLSAETKALIQSAMIGRPVSVNTREKLRVAKIGKSRPGHVRQILNSHNDKRSLAVAAEGQIFQSAAAAGRAFKVDTKTVHNRIASKSDRFASWFLINKG